VRLFPVMAVGPMRNSCPFVILSLHGITNFTLSHIIMVRDCILSSDGILAHRGHIKKHQPTGYSRQNIVSSFASSFSDEDHL